MSEYFEIGRIVNTQGVKGDVRIVPSTDDIKRFEKLEEVIVTTNKNVQILTIEKVWYNKKFVIIKFKEISNMTEGEKYKNSVITIPVSQGLKLKKDEYYMRDLYGMEVFEEGKFIGVLKDIIVTGANDVYSIIKEENQKELLIPAIKECILNIDVEKNKMEVNIIEGLQ